MKWDDLGTKNGRHVYAAAVMQREHPDRTRAAVRVTSEPNGKWRCDFAPVVFSVFAPWEPIDAIEHDTADAAKAHVASWDAKQL